MNLSRAHIISPIGFNRMRSTHYCALDWTHEQWRKYENKWSVTTRVSWSSSTAYPHGHGREIHLLLLLSYTNNWMKCKKKKKRKEKEKKSSTWTLHSSYSQSSTFLHHFDFSFFFSIPRFLPSAEFPDVSCSCSRAFTVDSYCCRQTRAQI